MSDPIQIDPFTKEIQKTNDDINDVDSDSDSDSDSFSAEGFLATIDPAHKDVLAPYVSEWDKQVTQEFQKRADKLRPYEELGADLSTIQGALQLVQYAESDPKGFYNYIKDVITDMGIDLDNDDSPPGDNLPEFEGVPEEFVKKYRGMETQLLEVQDFIKEQKAEREALNNQQQLDGLLKKLHTDHGDFDEPAVLGRIMQGMKPEEAVKDYLRVISDINSPRKIPPPTLRSGGTPLDQVDKSKFKDKGTRKAIITDLLTKAAEE